MFTQLLDKYNVAIPRYTSYPTVPFWVDNIDVLQWNESFTKEFNEKNSREGISLYLHLPFCEKLCTYCGCNKKITTNHSVEQEYMHAVLKEFDEHDLPSPQLKMDLYRMGKKLFLENGYQEHLQCIRPALASLS